MAAKVRAGLLFGDCVQGEEKSQDYHIWQLVSQRAFVGCIVRGCEEGESEAVVWHHPYDGAVRSP